MYLHIKMVLVRGIAIATLYYVTLAMTEIILHNRMGLFLVRGIAIAMTRNQMGYKTNFSCKKSNAIALIALYPGYIFRCG